MNVPEENFQAHSTTIAPNQEHHVKNILIAFNSIRHTSLLNFDNEAFKYVDI